MALHYKSAQVTDPWVTALSRHQQLGWKGDGSQTCTTLPPASIPSEHARNASFETIQQIWDFLNNRLVVSSCYNSKCSFVNSSRCLKHPIILQDAAQVDVF